MPMRYTSLPRESCTERISGHRAAQAENRGDLACNPLAPGRCALGRRDRKREGEDPIGRRTTNKRGVPNWWHEVYSRSREGSIRKKDRKRVPASDCKKGKSRCVSMTSALGIVSFVRRFRRIFAPWGTKILAERESVRAGRAGWHGSRTRRWSRGWSRRMHGHIAG